MPRSHGFRYLQQAVYDLPAHIVFVGGEESPLGELVDAFGDAVLGLQILGCGQSTNSGRRVSWRGAAAAAASYIGSRW